MTIARSAGSLTFPSNFMLIGALNPCPCGWYGDPVKECTCSNSMVSRYQADERRPASSFISFRTSSGPLLDGADP